MPVIICGFPFLVGSVLLDPAQPTFSATVTALHPEKYYAILEFSGNDGENGPQEFSFDELEEALDTGAFTFTGPF